MKARRYTGSFLARGGRTVRVELWQDAERPFTSIGELSFPADNPLEIEWSETAKHEVIERSHATLRIISESDRQFVDLYTDTPGTVRMDVYIDSALYWSGTLDPEQYTEPYERLDGYEVELTFGDLGILARKKYIDTGVKSIGQIVERCRLATECRLGDTLWLTGTTVSGEAAADAIGVSSDNWIDNDGEPRDLLTVLEASLQPLGMKVCQRSGRLVVYDLDTIAQTQDTTEVYWTGESQTLGVDKIYNKLVIKWSPYCRDGNLLEEDVFAEDYPPTHLTSLDVLGGQVSPASLKKIDAIYWSYLCPLGDLTMSVRVAGERGVAYTLWVSRNAETGDRGVRTIGTGPRLMAIVPQEEGQQQQGVAVKWMAFCRSTVMWQPRGVSYNNESGGYYLSLTRDVDVCTDWLNLGPDYNPLLRTDEVEIDNSDGRMQMRLTLPLLMSVKSVPMVGDSQGIDNGIFNHWKKYAQVIYVPIALFFRRASDGQVYIWQNARTLLWGHGYSPLMANCPSGDDLAGGTLDGWKAYNGVRRPYAWLTYYDNDVYNGHGYVESEDGSTAGNGGFVANRHALNPTLIWSMTDTFAKHNEGQRIALPPCAGTMWLEVLDNGWKARPRQYRVYESSNLSGIPKSRQIFKQDDYGAKWILLGAPKMQLETTEMYGTEIDTSGETYEVELAAAAESELSISTMCGVGEDVRPGARGAYISMSLGTQITTVRRGGNIGRPEELLGATMAAAYSTRHTVLSGEAAIIPGAMPVITEPNQGARRFWVSGETQNIIDMTSEISIVEVERDNDITR